MLIVRGGRPGSRDQNPTATPPFPPYARYIPQTTPLPPFPPFSLLTNLSALRPEIVLPKKKIQPLASHLATRRHAPSTWSKSPVENATILDLGQVDESIWLDLYISLVDGCHKYLDRLFAERALAKSCKAGAPLLGDVAGRGRRSARRGGSIRRVAGRSRSIGQTRGSYSRVDLRLNGLRSGSTRMDGWIVRVARGRVWLFWHISTLELLAHRLGQRVQVPKTRSCHWLLLLGIASSARAEYRS